MLVAKHNLMNRDCTDVGAFVIPVSMFLHSEFESANTGDKIHFYNGVGILLHCTAIPIKVVKHLGEITDVKSQLGNQLCVWLYSLSLTDCYKMWKANWNDISTEKILFVTYEPINLED